METINERTPPQTDAEKAAAPLAEQNPPSQPAPAMVRLRCTMPNASSNIDDVEFAPAEDGNGLISAPVTAKAARRFLKFAWFSIVE